MKLPIPAKPIEEEVKVRDTEVTKEERKQFAADVEFINKHWKKNYRVTPGYSFCSAEYSEGEGNFSVWKRDFCEDNSFEDWFIGWDPYKEDHTLKENK